MATALRKAFARGYRLADFRADVLAGLVVGVVAVPLSMALAIATGVAPQYGLYTTIVAGSLIALLGGSRVQVSGSTTAFVAVLVPITARHGLAGLCLATTMAGLIQIGFAVGGMGRLIRLVPYPVTMGFTTGIAVVIATLQVSDALGLREVGGAVHWPERVSALAASLPTADLATIAITAGTLLLLLLVPRLTSRVPAPLVALPLMALIAWLLEERLGWCEIEAVRDRFSWRSGGVLQPGIPSFPPLPVRPWLLPGSGGAAFEMTFAHVRELLPSAFVIAVLGSIESLLSAVVADGLSQSEHDPDGELLGQGIGNTIAPFFGGFAATGALARSATNVRAGAVSPIAAVIHALTVLAVVMVLAPLLGWLPMASLAALLLLVSWNMAELRHVVRTIRTSPRSDSFVLLSCFALTVVFDMVAAVGVGLVLASLVFLRRMAELSETRLIDGQHHQGLHQPAPPWLVIYEIAGPLFFGAAHRATSALHRVHVGAKAVMLDLRSVPIIDATGLVNLHSAVDRLERDGKFVILAGASGNVRASLELSQIAGERTVLATSLEEGVRLARERIESPTSGH